MAGSAAMKLAAYQSSARNRQSLRMTQAFHHASSRDRIALLCRMGNWGSTSAWAH